MFKIFQTFVPVLITLSLISGLSAQEHWNRFRGPNGTGLAADADLPATWQKPLWKIKLAGVGGSSPVVWGDKLFVTSCDMDTAEVKLECFRLADGRRDWIEKFSSKPYPLHGRNTYATSTPAVDADHIYLTYANPEQTLLVALDHQGNEVWRRDFGRWISTHGFGMSPIVHGDRVFFCNSQTKEKLPAGVAPGSSRMIAVNRLTGKDDWSVDLTTRRVCYGVPCIWRGKDGKDQLVNCNTGDGFYSIDPETGSKNWSALPFKMRVVASPLAVGEWVIGSCGSGGGGNYLVAVKPDQKSETGQISEAYQSRRSSYVPCPVAVAGLLFVFTDKGIAQCLDLETGEMHWQKRVSPGFSGSPVATSQHVYCMDEDGKVVVVGASSTFELLGKTPLGEATRATPVIVGNNILFRTESQLICVGKSD